MAEEDESSGRKLLGLADPMVGAHFRSSQDLPGCVCGEFAEFRLNVLKQEIGDCDERRVGDNIKGFEAPL